MAELYYEEQPREDITSLQTWELDIEDILEYFRKIKIGNENFLEAIRFAIATENKITSLSDTREEIMRKLALKVAKNLVKMISINPEYYGLERHQIPFVGTTFAKLFYQLCMKSVGGGERAYRGKIIRVETRAEAKEETSGLNIPLKK
jgi:hypothetical protein